MAEFAYNNWVMAGNAVTPFYTNFRFHPTTLDPPVGKEPLNPASTVHQQKI